MYLKENRQANQGISKYKLLSSYGGAGSLVHTEYGSIIISCIEEWGFMKIAEAIYKEELDMPGAEVLNRTCGRLSNQGIKVSNDNRFLELIKAAKRINNLQALVLVPDIELDEVFNQIIDNTDQAITSTFFPKTFLNKSRYLKLYSAWHYDWEKKNKRDIEQFFPPKYINQDAKEELLLQDNLALICENGHISDFPWSKYLNWKRGNPKSGSKFVPSKVEPCCNKPLIRITENQGNVSGYEGKYLSCNGGCKGREGVTLKGLFSLKITCTGEKPWEVHTGKGRSYYGDNNARWQNPPAETCKNENGMKVALTTGNNLYFSRNISGIYIPDSLTQGHSVTILERLEKKKQSLLLDDVEIEEAKSQALDKVGNILDAVTGKRFSEDDRWEATRAKFLGESLGDMGPKTMKEFDQSFRYDEFKVFTSMSDEQINIEPEGLIVKDVTSNLDPSLRIYFNKILRLENLKLTTTQLDFTRVFPLDSDLAEEDVSPKNIFRSENQFVNFYPAVESFGEGIFFAFNTDLLSGFSFPSEVDGHDHPSLAWNKKPVNRMSNSAVQTAIIGSAQLYAVHTFAHLIMRELEFTCGYPTPSLSERLYISNDPDKTMYGVLIMTTEGSEGSMGGLIAQTKRNALNRLIKKALLRAELCPSDPLCWDSEGQGLFEMNLAACFSCGLVSETSCEQRNILLDRRILVDEEFGLFRDIINS